MPATLFDPVTIGSLALPNRIVMAPLTRARANERHVPSALQAEYYAQRADAGLIISEATSVAALGTGWYRAPGIWTPEMVSAWQDVTQAVHEAGGRIYAQLWHMGRLVLPDYLNGAQPVGPSPIAGEGETFAPRPDGDEGLFLPMKPYVVPREMAQSDIDEAVKAYGSGARNAMHAGFDGVEIHGANGYLIDQFLQSKTNHRSDSYGVDVLGRTKFLAECIDAVREHVEPGRIGLRISPTSERKGMGDIDPMALTRQIATVAQAKGIAYIHLIEAIAPGFTDVPETPVIDLLRDLFAGAVIQNGSFDAESGSAQISEGKADAVSFGRPYIANPDLVTRFRDGLPLAAPDFDYAYVGEARGYTDYPIAQSASVRL